MMVGTGISIELLFQSTIDQIGLADKVQPSDIDICGFNGSREERVGKIILPIMAGPTIVDVVFYVFGFDDWSRFGGLGRGWIDQIQGLGLNDRELLSGRVCHLLSPNGVLFNSIFSVDRYELVKYVFPVEKLPEWMEFMVNTFGVVFPFKALLGETPSTLGLGEAVILFVKSLNSGLVGLSRGSEGAQHGENSWWRFIVRTFFFCPMGNSIKNAYQLFGIWISYMEPWKMSLQDFLDLDVLICRPNENSRIQKTQSPSNRDAPKDNCESVYAYTSSWEVYVLSNYLYYSSPVMHFLRFVHKFLHTDMETIIQMVWKIHLCKSWRTWSALELLSILPLAVAGGQETSIVLRGQNLTIPGTKYHYAYMGGYTSKVVLVLVDVVYDDTSLESFSFPGGLPNVLSHCFIERMGLKGTTYFPVFIDNSLIYKELRLLEAELNGPRVSNVTLENQVQDLGKPKSREDALHFLNELGCTDSSRKYLFFLNQSGPGGVTPLHLAACMNYSEHIVDVLINDPQEFRGGEGFPYKMASTTKIANMYIDLTWEKIWGDHIHLGFYDLNTTTKPDRKIAQFCLIEEALRFDNVSEDSVKKPKSIVDVGCGISVPAIYLAKMYGAKCICIDISPYNVKRGTEISNAQGLGDKVTLQVGDAL
ncbi:hypothetical protein GIB67_009185 [Kingdonia uniflora]|uniref:Uncharacterized protein n=1 Tax=Kingdonia uniflora TaxID=39325 RepID=A0A7J7N305_9MAGN|nr:hypothetical protein GIB67_009185 [Kingdonia uniflora]